MHYLKTDVGSAVRNGTPTEDPNYLTWTNKGLVPTLWLGQDELGSYAMHQTMFVLCLT